MPFEIKFYREPVVSEEGVESGSENSFYFKVKNVAFIAIRESKIVIYNLFLLTYKTILILELNRDFFDF